MRLPLAMSLCLLALLALVGCGRARSDSPESAYKDFHKAVRQQNYKSAYALLSKPTQDALQARAQTVAQASGGSVKADPLAFFFANVPPPADVTEVTLSSEEGDTARLNVVSSNGKSQVRMVREATGWKVDLTESLQQP